MNTSPTIVTPPMCSSPRNSTSCAFRVTDTRHMMFQQAAPPLSPISRRDSLGSPKLPSPPSGAPRKTNNSFAQYHRRTDSNGSGSNCSTPTAGGMSSCASRNSSSTSILARRLQFEVYAQRRTQLPPREDLDMTQQCREAEQRTDWTRAEWIAANKPLPMSDRNSMYSLKCLIVEAERFQRLRKMDSLKVAVVLRAVHTMGTNCPSNYYEEHEASEVLFGDMDHLMLMPKECLPECGAVAFAQREVYSFPMWGNSPPSTALAVSRNDKVEKS